MMPKRIFQKFLPHPSKIAEHRSLQFMSHLMKDSNLWHLNRRSVASGIFIGLFCALLPIPGQMPLAALMAIFMRGNLPLAVCTTWVSNPLTYAPIFYFTYKIGAIILQTDVKLIDFELSWDSINTNFQAIWKPLFLGSFLCGLAIATSAYLAIRIYWRQRVLMIWEKRKERKKQQKQSTR